MRILLIALHYHDYTSNIAAELRALGHELTVHDIMPRDLLMKGLRIISPGLWQSRLDQHHARILERERGDDYDMVLFIQAHQMSAANMAGFKAAFSGARFVLYNWDSIANHDYRPHLQAFDDVFTFDPDDAREYGLRYLPLFCSRDFQDLPRREQDRSAVYFVGNVVNPARYEAVAAFRDYCERHLVPFQAFMACTPPARLKLRRAGLKPEGLSFGSIGKAEFKDMIETSVAAFDFANHHQSGYTMRVFENLCAGKKIITNNPRIARERFYSPDRIHVFSGLDFSGVKAFVDLPLAEPDAQFPEYRIQAFVRHLVDGTGHPLPPPQS
ncbi:MAG: hypothetical protein HYU62_13145 [Caulobacterales bacterium]|nr:hypothetical protein [Caulobacterales bacterium]